MGSDECHFNVSVRSDGQSHRTVSTNHNLFEEKGEPKRYRTEVLPLTSLSNALPLGHTGSHGGGGRGRLYTYRYTVTVTSRMTPALRWAAMTASLMSRLINCRGRTMGSVSTDKPQPFRRESGREPKRNRAALTLNVNCSSV